MGAFEEGRIQLSVCPGPALWAWRGPRVSAGKGGTLQAFAPTPAHKHAHTVVTAHGGGQVGTLAAGSHVRGALPALPGDGRLAWPRRALWAAPQHPSLRPGPSRRPSGRSGQPRASPSTPGRWPCPDRCPGLAQRVAPGRPPPPRGLRLARLGPRRRSGAFEDIACDEIFLRFRL